jgi:hypothetical protein
MATLNPTLTITGTAAEFGHAVNVSITDAIVLGAGKATIHKIILPDDIVEQGSSGADTNPQIFDASMGRCWIYVKNLESASSGTGRDIFLTETADEAVDGDVFLNLLPQEFAFFPWAGVMDIFANTGPDGSEGGLCTDGLEYMLWEV